MAATLASLWEKKKKVQANHVTNRVDLTSEELGQTVNPNRQTDVSDSLSEQCQGAVTVSSSKQFQGPDKKRKRAQVAEPSAQQIQILASLLGSGRQPSTEEIKCAAESAAVCEQLVISWIDEQHEKQAKKASVAPLSAKPAAPMLHGTGGSAPVAQTQGSEAVGQDDHVVTAAGLADNKHDKISSGQRPSEASADVTAAAAQLTQPNKNASPKQEQSISKQHILEQHQSALKQAMQQAQAVKPLADLPLFTDGHLNRTEVQTC